MEGSALPTIFKASTAVKVRAKGAELEGVGR